MLQVRPGSVQGNLLSRKAQPLLPVSPETGLPDQSAAIPPKPPQGLIPPPKGAPSAVSDIPQLPPDAELEGIDNALTGQQAIQEGKAAYMQDAESQVLREADPNAFINAPQDQTLEGLTGSEFGNRPGFHLEYNEQTGEYEEVPMSQHDFRVQQEFEAQQAPTFQPGALDFTQDESATRAKLAEVNRVAQQAKLLRSMETDRNKYSRAIEQADSDTDKEASDLDTVVRKFNDRIENGAFTADFNSLMNVPSQHDETVPSVAPEHRGTVVSLLALSELDSVTRDEKESKKRHSPDEESPEVPVDSAGKPVDQGQYLKDKISSMDSSLAIGLERAGISMPQEQRRQFAALKLADSLHRGDYKEVMGRDNQRIIVPTDRMVTRAKGLQQAIKGVVGGYGRLAPGRTKMIAGANLLAGGPQVVGASKSSFSLLAKEAKAKAKATGDESFLIQSDAAIMTMDMFGSIDERVPEISAQLYAKIVNEVLDPKMQHPLGYSLHPLADKLSFGEKSYNKAKRKYEPDSKRGAPDAETRKKLAEAHATAVFIGKKDPQTGVRSNTGRNTQLRTSLDNTMKLIPGPQDKSGFFTPYTRSIINGRFYRDAALTDIGADKDGVRNTLNFGMREGVQASTIDPTKPDNLKKIRDMQSTMKGLKKHLGANFSAELDKAFTPQQQQALGLMALAVRDRRSVENSAWNRVSPIDLITSYDAGDYAYMVEMGKKVDAWLNEAPADPENPLTEANDPLADFKKTIAGPDGLERGAFQDKLNLWHDFFKLNQLSEGAGDPFYQPTALATLDGVQNGVFLTGLFTGSDKVLKQLGSHQTLSTVDSENQKLEDLRALLYNNIGTQIDTVISDKEKAAQWKELFKVLKETSDDRKKLYDDFSKNPIMQYSYGKDASMFKKEMAAFINQDRKGRPQEILSEIEDAYKGNREAMAKELARIMESSLRASISNSLTDMNKNFGWGYALLNRVPHLKDVTGDDVLLGTSDLGVVRRFAGEEASDTYASAEGEQGYDLRVDAPVSDNFGGIDVERFKPQHQAAFAKGEKAFWNEETGEFDYYTPEFGSGLANQMGVVMVQATDASLLKLMMVAVNKDRKVPLPVRTVHDSIATTPRGYLHYSNAYNNVAIPQAKNSIKSYAKDLSKDYFKQRDEVFEEVLKEGVPVGIGSAGKFPAISSFFDNIQDKFFGKGAMDYRDNVFVKGNTPEAIAKGHAGFKEAQSRALKLLKEARALGYVPPFGQIGDEPATSLDAMMDGDPKHRQYVAIKPSNFRKLVELIEARELRLIGPSDKVRGWVSDFEHNVDDGYDTLKLKTKGTGIGQMSF